MDVLRAPALASGEIEQIAWKIGVEVAGPAAADVDENARFPEEAVAAMRDARLLAALVPREMGGLGATVREVAGAVRALAGHCASSALVLAMHSIEIGNLVRWGTSGPLQDFLVEVGERQLLLANANSEVGIGGDVGRSLCALEPRGDGFVLVKKALAISYGLYADAIVTIARRTSESAETDQVMMVCRAEDLTLEPLSSWNTIGLRGTCSQGFELCAQVDPKLIFPTPFATIAARGAGQLRQILLSAAWAGIAEEAAARAHLAVRKAARKDPTTTPPAAVRLSEVLVKVQEARALLASAAGWYEEVKDDDRLEDAEFSVALRTLKVATSQLAVDVATAALQICGIEGYRRDSPISLDRLIRDAHGGLVMVSNERHLHDNASVLRGARAL